MKIAFIISSLASGGAERVLSTLANYFCQKHSVYLITFTREKPFYELHRSITHIPLDLMKNSPTPLASARNTFRRVFAIRKILKEINADVNVSFMTHTNILSIIATRLNNQRIIISERIEYSFYTSKILFALRRAFYPMANLLVTQTFADKANYPFMKQRVEVIRNPLQLPPIIRTEEKIVLAVGRLDKQKAFDKLIDAFAQIDTTEWRLFIIGEGSERNMLEEKIRELGASNIYLSGKQHNVFEWYAKSPIFVLSSQKEGFPNALLEAMGSGCACISFDCPNGPSEIIEHGKNGLLVENQNVELLAFHLKQLIYSPDLRKRLGSEASKIREKYCLTKIAGDWEQALLRVQL